MKPGSKSQMEIIEFLILIIGIMVFLAIVYSFSVRRIATLAESLEEYHSSSRILLTTTEIYYSQITGTNRTLAQLIGDMLTSKKEVINYGYGLGELNVSEIIKYFFDKNLEKNWLLDLNFMKLGNEIPSGKRVFTAELLIPKPSFSGEIEKIFLYWW